ncbi:putative toxin-antitoxin system toxin component, PIN family [Komagataeibacter xylinus]|uniref:Putative toxin-antitoxin system toxin component, PIN family n=3 Tax=Komagataeibacter TaxID=1434011 RepID=A0A318QKK4_9PROT|nr:MULTISPECIES: putative toxin-antitoxin system toxin component, PIN family [Komagataeibacter]AHI27201.1 PilT domain-containing protein [Komagataeibacter xylinus E25]MCF3634899.1 putative toxin-antitoxin system toxin component, PIN family [Komagataeibacter intermedius]PYD55978.1 putative toxin-antitoxin system toxin component, PIN family [Komagataeibacter xylinus]PYD77762.1 putative toxin-antitoxin system toxin component, PIN family [Komagataeibacter sucrofermentans]RFP00928.1 putative toxin-
MRVVLDTDVVLSGFMSPDGASRQLLLGALDRNFSLLLSTTLLVEYEAVLRRSENLFRMGVQGDEVLEVLDGLAGCCVPVSFDYRWRPTGAHGDDELVVETAINGNADAIATFNLKDMQRAVSRFGIPAVRPGVLLRRMRG